eukprot:TRINITY_DN5812_c0_g1_i4.p1 TRINITY_DN5812_c0_g1~~TRINITY_DN5812_c0_g1_i4.p1  ORF type:complete len:195 (+),score=35.26 TRINITY_DN5812_c0_g1_i4:225-809(+)
MRIVTEDIIADISGSWRGCLRCLGVAENKGPEVLLHMEQYGNKVFMHGRAVGSTFVILGIGHLHRQQILENGSFSNQDETTAKKQTGARDLATEKIEVARLSLEWFAFDREATSETRWWTLQTMDQDIACLSLHTGEGDQMIQSMASCEKGKKAELERVPGYRSKLRDNSRIVCLSLERESVWSFSVVFYLDPK